MEATKIFRLATIVGQGIDWLMAMAGIAMIYGVYIPFLGTGIISGLWLAFIGWFLVNAASQSYQRVMIEDLLEGVPISRLIREPPQSVPPDLSGSSLVYDYLILNGENAYPVMDGDQLLGMVYSKDVGKIDRSAWDSTPVREVMVPETELDAVALRDDAMDAFQKMTQQEVHQVPVIQNGTFVGILRRKDIMRWLQLHSEAARG